MMMNDLPVSKPKGRNILELMDKVWVGLVIGTLVPIGIFSLLYMYNANELEGIRLIFSNTKTGYLEAKRTFFIRFTTISLLPSAATFFYFIWRNYNEISKGILIGILIFGALMYILYRYSA